MVAIIICYCITCVVFDFKRRFLSEIPQWPGNIEFASDAFGDHIIAGSLADILREGDYSGWWALPVHSTPAYVKIYSVFYYLLGKSPLSLIPLNAALYLFVVLMTFSVRKALFSESVGFWSAVLVGMLPSFLLHATHSAKDSISIGGLLLILHAITLFIKGAQSKRSISILVANASVGFWILWLFRPYMLQLAGFLWFCALVIGVIRGLRKKRKYGRTIGLGLILFIVFGVVSGSWCYDWSRALFDVVRGEKSTFDPKAEAEYCKRAKMEDDGFCLAGCPGVGRPAFNKGIYSPFCRLMMIEHARWKFRNTSPESTSNIDRKISFRSPGDILRYMPRAIQIGLLAPFPRMWFSPGGASGRVGRLIAGVETGLMYVGLLLAFFCIWKERSNPPVWLMSFFILYGVTLLGLVVINIGALYRHRYIYWFLLIILAVQGFNRLREISPSSRGIV